MNFFSGNQTFILVILAFVVLGLSVYLGILLGRIKKQNQLIAQEKSKRDDFVKESIRTIALATIQGQCDYSECCIRVKNLIDYFPELSQKDDYQVLHQMYDEIKEFPTHELRREQTKKVIFEQDSKRFKIEAKYEDRLLKCLESLKAEIS